MLAGLHQQGGFEDHEALGVRGDVEEALADQRVDGGFEIFAGAFV